MSCARWVGSVSKMSYQYRITIIKIRRSWDRLIFIMGIPYLDRQSLYQDGLWALTSFNMISTEHSTPSFSPLAANITLCRETGCRSVFLVSELPSTLAVPVDTTTSKFTEELVLSFRPSLGLQVGHGLMSSGRLCYLMDWKRTAYVMHSDKVSAQ